MPTRSPPRWRDVRTGVTLLAAIAVAATMVFFLDELRRALEEGPRLRVVTLEAPGLGPGSPVWVAGKPSGRVLSVRFRPPRRSGRGEVVIEAVLSRDVGEMIRMDATASVEPAGLLAPVVLSVDPGTIDAAPFPFGDTLRAVEPTMEPEEVMALADSLGDVLMRLRPLRDDLSRALEEGSGTLPALWRDDAVLTRLTRRLEEAGAVLDRLLEGRGTLGRLLSDTVLTAHLARAGERARAVPDLAGVRAAADARLTVAAALDSLQRTAAAVDSLLRTGSGTAGRVMYDDAIGRELALLRARLDSVRAELVGEPFRWLRFRLF